MNGTIGFNKKKTQFAAFGMDDSLFRPRVFLCILKIASSHRKSIATFTVIEFAKAFQIPKDSPV